MLPNKPPPGIEGFVNRVRYDPNYSRPQLVILAQRDGKVLKRLPLTKAISDHMYQCAKIVKTNLVVHSVGGPAISSAVSWNLDEHDMVLYLTKFWIKNKWCDIAESLYNRRTGQLQVWIEDKRFWNQKILGLEDLVDKFRARNEELMDKIRKQKSVIHKDNSDGTNDSKRKVEAQARQIRYLEEKILNLESITKKLQKEKRELMDRLKDRRGRGSKDYSPEMRKKMSEHDMEREIKILYEEADEKDDDYKELNMQLQDFQKEASKLRKICASKTQATEELRDYLAKNTRYKKELEKEIRELRENIKGLNRSLGMREREVDQLREENSSYLEIIKSLREPVSLNQKVTQMMRKTEHLRKAQKRAFAAMQAQLGSSEIMEIYGSHVHGIQTLMSDVDVACLIDDMMYGDANEKQSTKFEKIRRRIKEPFKIVNEVRSNGLSRMQLEYRGHIEVDLVVHWRSKFINFVAERDKAVLGILASETMRPKKRVHRRKKERRLRPYSTSRGYSEEDNDDEPGELRKFLTIVKCWAQTNGICDAYKGTMNGYTWLQVGTFFLRHRFGEKLEKSWPRADRLFLDFIFFFYDFLVEGQYKRFALCPQSGKLVDRSWRRSVGFCALDICDGFEMPAKNRGERNLAHPVSRDGLNRILRVVKDTLDVAMRQLDIALVEVCFDPRVVVIDTPRSSSDQEDRDGEAEQSSSIQEGKAASPSPPRSPQSDHSPSRSAAQNHSRTRTAENSRSPYHSRSPPPDRSQSPAQNHSRSPHSHSLVSERASRLTRADNIPHNRNRRDNQFSPASENCSTPRARPRGMDTEFDIRRGSL